MKYTFDKLNLGCGWDYKKGYLNIDSNSLVNPDIIYDLNNLPYPFKKNQFKEIYCSHVIEHLYNNFKVISELHRILKVNGLLILKVPHFSRGFTSADHRVGFDVTYPLYFNKYFLGSGFFGLEFKVVSIKFKWLQNPELLRKSGIGAFTIFMAKIGDRIINFLANLNPYFCSRVWCFYVGGFEEIEFKMIAIKKL